jgi:ribosomal-protein-alanine N-acetyltransferase
LDKASFSLPWTERSYIFEITKNETSIHLVALDTAVGNNGKLAGFIVVWAIEDEAHIGTIAVAEGYRRRGIAQLLISAALSEAAKRGAEKVFLEVRAGNLPAHNLYLKLGFIDFDLRKKYYVDNQEDAIIMLLDPLRVEMGGEE